MLNVLNGTCCGTVNSCNEANVCATDDERKNLPFQAVRLYGIHERTEEDPGNQLVGTRCSLSRLRAIPEQQSLRFAVS
ncbi:hypothetical protein EAH_00048130 [Eimeria acervulina]|uniref:Uncharacterized protein n=1 Tax=Eimeria acervulina TaxID=5801 RepID=U6H009_EIMAC|nr:hypothetical protein EAH_00048130 [Eimeria acervulina]CDI84079.1 hypothetical protein EAH_00048130 [Eimeria acervulina]